ncbi:hypothetical protein QBC45DRAFT_453927 [Copromyces sp. CBS 386.78]|nr:hypothetical protein QBC45DRAFT_453927 [Copromyces sp. CBS 386.78]
MTDHDHDMDDLSLPIALRRTRRTGTGTAIRHPVVGVACTRETSPPTPPRTPRRNRKNRITKTVRVRGGKTQFSPDSAGLQQLLEDELSLSTTGLTPMVRRTSLQPPSPAPAPAAASGSANTSSRRPPSAPISTTSLRLSSTPQPNTSDTDTAAALNSRISTKRRSIGIRRNASLTLSEEKMNRVYTEWRKREKEAQEEIERLRAELREKDKVIERFYDDTVDLDLEVPVEVDRERGGLDRDIQHPRSPETPSNPTFHTALDHDPGSGSETEAFSLTTSSSQFSEAIRAQLDCSTPPPSGSRARYRRPFPTTTTTAAAVVPSPPTTSPFAMGMNMVPARTELPITPCSNFSGHGESALSSSMGRTSNATTIHAHNLHHDDDEEPEATPTRSRASPSSSASASAHHHHQLQNQLQRPPLSSASTQSQQQQQQRNRDQHQHPDSELLHHHEELATLQASLLRTRRSLGAALEMVNKFQLESEQLRGETLLLEREKKELLAGVVRDVQGMRGEVVRKAVERRDEMWKGRLMALVREGVHVVEGRLGEGIGSGVGVGDGGGVGVNEGGGDGESVDLGSRLGHSGDGTDSGSYDDGLEDMERRIMRMRARMMRKRRRRTGGFGSEEEEEEEEADTDPDA